MVEVNEALTRKVANLARLKLSDEEVQLFTLQLGDILKYVEQLQEVSVQNIDPLVYPLSGALNEPLDRLSDGADPNTSLREDKICPFPKDAEGKSKVLLSAPEVLYDGFKVPPIL